MSNRLTLALQKLFASFVPVQTRTIYDRRQTPPTLATLLDADRIHGIFSDAEAGNTRDLFTLYRDILIGDSHLQGELGKRKLAVLGDVLNFLPIDKAVPEDVAAALFGKGVLDTPGWIHACSHLLNSVLWPCAVLEKVYAPVAGGFALSKLVPVPYELLDFRLGRLMIQATDPKSGLPTAELLEPDPARYIVHRGHLLGTPDQWGGPMRSLVFWWFFSAMDRDAWARFLDRYGSPFLVGKYEQSDDASRTILERAFSNATRIFGLVISKETEVELQQAATATTGEAFALFHSVAQREKSKLILGQTLSAEAQATGLGSGTSDLQGEVRQDIRQFDALLLGTTLRDGLLAQYLRINGQAGRPPRMVWGSESAMSLDGLGKFLVALSQAGLQVGDASLPVLSERAGLSIVRGAAPAPAMLPLSLLPLSARSLATGFPHRAEAAMDRIASAGSADLAQRFRETFAPIRRIILASHSPEDLEHRLRAFAVGWSPEEIASLIEDSLTAFAANGTLITDR